MTSLGGKGRGPGSAALIRLSRPPRPACSRLIRICPGLRLSSSRPTMHRGRSASARQERDFRALMDLAHGFMASQVAGGTVVTVGVRQGDDAE